MSIKHLNFTKATLSKRKIIKKAIVNVEVDIDVILLNDRAFNNLDRDDLIDWFKRKIRLRLRHSQTLGELQASFQCQFLKHECQSK